MSKALDVFSGYTGAYYVVRFANEHKALGSFDVHQDGFLTRPNRKPVGTMPEAVLQVLDKAIKSRQKEIDRLTGIKLRILAGEVVW